MFDHTKFDQLCEQAITNTTKMFYPRNLKFSEKFLQAFKEEYKHQKKTVTEEKGDKAFGNHFERMLKGLRFEAKKIEDENKPKAKQKPKLVEAKREKGPDPMGSLRPRNPVTGNVIGLGPKIRTQGQKKGVDAPHQVSIVVNAARKNNIKIKSVKQDDDGDWLVIVGDSQDVEFLSQIVERNNGFEYDDGSSDYAMMFKNGKPVCICTPTSWFARHAP